MPERLRISIMLFMILGGFTSLAIGCLWGWGPQVTLMVCGGVSFAAGLIWAAVNEDDGHD